ncbi:MAG TPA: hypothetical protein VN132_09995, partial [Bdellovibrio sp.]|nr:hypothetical protein [Bdellovibrio sp.]
EHRNESFAAVQTGEDSSRYLQRILKTYLAMTAPSFLAKVEESLERVSLNDDAALDATGILMPIEDTGEIKNLNDSKSICAVVQIAVRFAKVENGKIFSVVGLDHALFNKLGMNNGKIDSQWQIINQAGLRLHEALYLLGYGLGQTTSESVRGLSANLISADLYDYFSQQIKNSKGKWPHSGLTLAGMQSFFMIQTLYQNGFGDFPIIEKAEMSDRKKNFRDAYDRLEEAFMQMKDSVNQVNFPEPLRTQVLSAMLAQIFSELDETSAFIASAELTLAAGTISDFYTLLDPAQDSEVAEKATCKAVKDLLHEAQKGVAPQTLLFKSMLENAQRFCEKTY